MVVEPFVKDTKEGLKDHTNVLEMKAGKLNIMRFIKVFYFLLLFPC